MVANASIFTLPLFWFMGFIPHLVGVNVLGDTYDNGNPRSVEGQAHAASALGQRRYALYERLEGIHKNSTENMPLFYAAVIVGNLANLHAAELNGLSWAYIVSRIIYTALYVIIPRGPATYLRTLVFMAGVILNLYLLIRGGIALV